MIFYNNNLSKKREILSFKMGREFNKNLFKNVLSLAKLMITPKVDRSSFKDYCENIKLR